MTTLGLDIGGANLKAVFGEQVRVRSFALWKRPNELAREITELVAGWLWNTVALTMTGELCDCFPTKSDGVRAIVAATQPLGSVRVWTTDGRFVSAEQAIADPIPCAAGNWLALATAVAQRVPRGVLVDIGSTTCDITAIDQGKPILRGRTDRDRMASSALVYTGARRTPMCAIMGFAGMAEWFATTLDVGLILGQIPENAGDTDTADGRPATRSHAHARIVRMVGADTDSMSWAEAVELAEQCLARQIERVRHAIEEVAPPDWPVIVAGSGAYIARSAAGGRPIVDLAVELSPEKSVAACAWAVAELASCES